jgi:amino-acid N-acetyltransferase
VTQAEQWTIRRARTSDIRAIASLIEPLVEARVLLGKDLVVLYESVQEFTVATRSSGEVVGCGALHVFGRTWVKSGPSRCHQTMWGKGIGTAVVEALEEQARDLGLSTLFCLTFEVDFFTRSRVPHPRRPDCGAGALPRRGCRGVPRFGSC